MSERWDNYFLGAALHAAGMSKDPSTRVGAVIVGPLREVRSTGFNGFPRGIADDARLLDRDTKLGIIVHAEMNAIMAAARIGVPLDGCTLYVVAMDDTGAVWGGSPCTRCSVHIIQAGITQVVSRPKKSAPLRWRADMAHAEAILREAGVTYREVVR